MKPTTQGDAIVDILVRRQTSFATLRSRWDWVGVAVVVGIIFFRAGTRAASPFVNFAPFRNARFTGATIANFLLNGVAGMLLVSTILPQLGGGLFRAVGRHGPPESLEQVSLHGVRLPSQ